MISSLDPLGDGLSLVELVGHVGDDSSVVRSARVSFAGDGRPFDEERDGRLIRFLLENGHWSPFEHPHITLHVRCPIFVARQWMRHSSWSFNEISRRYTSEEIEFYVPRLWRGQSGSNRQASEGEVEIGSLSKRYEEHLRDSLFLYRSLLERGAAREMARMVLPQSLYTRMYATASLRSALHFLSARLGEDAQHEIRLYAGSVSKILEGLFPVTLSCYRELYELSS